MSRAVLLAAVIAVAGVGQTVHAQDKAADIIANVRKTIGLGEPGKVRTFSIDARSTRHAGDRELTAEVELYMELPARFFRVDQITSPVTQRTISGFDGEKVIRPAGQTPGGGGTGIVMSGAAMTGGGAFMTRMEGGGGGGRPAGAGRPSDEEQAMLDAAAIRSQRVELSRLMLGWFGMAHPALNARYTYAGLAESPDGKAHVIDVKADGGFDVKLFIDEATNRPLMISYEASEGRLVLRGSQSPANAPLKERVEHRIYFSDWKETDGVSFPRTLKRAMDGTVTEEWVITDVKVNPSVDFKKLK